MDFVTVVSRRRMVRNYTGEGVPSEVLDRVMDLARKTPSAGFSQGQSFVVVTGDDLRRRIAELTGETNYVKAGFDSWISKAPAIVVCCTSEELYRQRYREPDKLGADGSEIEWPVPYWFIDAGCSMMLLLLAAVNEGLAAGFLGMNREGYEGLRRVLGIPREVTPIGLITLGYPAPDRRSGSLRRGWRTENEVIHRERWGS